LSAAYTNASRLRGRPLRLTYGRRASRAGGSTQIMSKAVVAAIAVAALQKRLTTVVTVLPSAGAMVATPTARATQKPGEGAHYARSGAKDLGSKV